MRIMRRICLIVMFTIFTAGCSPLGFGIKHNTDQITVVATKQYNIVRSLDRDAYEKFYDKKSSDDVSDVLKGAIVPHHLLAGYLPAQLFQYLSHQKPSTIVILSPNHFSAGPGTITSGVNDWQTDFGTVAADRAVVDRLSRGDFLKIHDAAIAQEHGIFGLIPFIAKSIPGTKIIPIMLKDGVSYESLDQLTLELSRSLPADAFILASIDCSHYQSWPVANFHDEYTRSVIQNFDFEHIKDTEIDSPASLYAILRLMRLFGTEKIVHETSDNAANIMGRPSVPQTTSYISPWFATGKSSPQKTASFLFFGDMMLDRNVKKRIDEHGASWIFSDFAGEEKRFLRGVNFVSANLEGPLSDSRRATTKEIAFRFDPALIPTLTDYYFNIFTIANNHSLDMSQKGLAESIANLDRAHIDHYGDGYGIGDQAILNRVVDGLRVAFVGFNDTYFRLDDSEVVKKITEAKSGADIVVVNIHWGDEYQPLSNTRQRALAHLMIDSGADVIIGHHPHVVEEMEVYRGRPIFYSLGNFVFDQYFSPETQQGLAVGLIASTSTLSVSVFPLRSVQSQVKLVPYIDAWRYLLDWQKNSRIGENHFINFNFKLNI